MNSSELYQAGQLKEAVDAALGEVKKTPNDLGKRFQLCELLCFAGDFERADKQLDTIMQQSTEAAVRIMLTRQLIRAETARQDFYTEGRLPQFLSDVSPVLRLHLDASIAIREGNVSEAAELLSRAEEQRVRVSGECNGQRFDDIRDLDDLTAPFLEVLTSNGTYYWVPLEKIHTIEFRPPERPIDLLWRSMRVTMFEGPDGEVYQPTLYAGTHLAEDNQLRLGRGTDWKGGDGKPARGLGLRMFLVGDDAKSVMELKTIRCEPASGAS
jgi:type VI secretion system protein ImpE